MENKKISYKQAQKVLAKRDPYVGVLLEEVNDKLKTLIDGQEVLHGRVDRLGGNMGRMEGRLDRVEAQLDGVDIRFDRIETRLDGVEAKIDRVEVKFDILADNIRKKVDKEKVIALEHRVAKLES